MSENPKTFNDYDDLTEVKVEEATEDRYEFESDFEDLLHIDNDQPNNPRKRKSVSLCRHKLQGQTGYRSRSWKLPAHEIRDIQDAEVEDEDEVDNEWAQLQRMERLLEQQRIRLLQQGVPDSDGEDWDE